MDLVTAFLNAFNATLQDVIDAIPQQAVATTWCHDALAITDTANYDAALNLTWCPGRRCIEVYNGCDQAVSITLLVYDVPTGIELLYASDAQVVAANRNSHITAAAIPALLEPLQQLVLRANYTVAPTTGTLNTFVDAVA